ncbi:hypothetical protein BU16DRAFT_131013 [Lophium mytilinum]|uniref:BTB domain-containing protein n=1 Tax=Lophium mytilinum TaxID=390894 RepID=A0A6A6QIG1_9PEZI|nr:hypothetical protein BU16DRAFT_131013 [Lophium mytilinum]
MGEGKDTPLNELLTPSLVTIKVGPNNTEYALHEALLTARSQFFAKTFSSSSTDKSYTLPDEDPEPFQSFVHWLYSAHTPTPAKEADLDVLYDLYLLGSKFRARALQTQVMAQIKHWYKESDTYPGLRRVQYVYANTEEGSKMRAVLVSSVARGLVLRGDGIPQHWDKALRKNGMLAVDLVRAVQSWGLSPERVPDARAEEWPEVKDDDEEEDEEVEEEEDENTEVDEEAGQEQAQGEDVKQESKGEDVKKEELMGQLPNGLVNGVH